MKSLKTLYWILMVTIPVLLFPLFMQAYALHIMITCFYYIILACSWNLVAGYSGQISLAQAALAGLGSYTSALFVMRTGLHPVIGILVAGIFGWGLSYCLGIMCLRLKGPYLTLATLGFAASIQMIITHEYYYTGGDTGLGYPNVIEPIFQTYSKVPYYYASLGLLAVSLFVLYEVVHSHAGLYLRAIRDDEDAASAMGVEVTKWRTLAFSIAGLLTGLAGGFYAHYEGTLSPSTLALGVMTLIMAMAVFGRYWHLSWAHRRCNSSFLSFRIHIFKFRWIRPNTIRISVDRYDDS